MDRGREWGTGNGEVGLLKTEIGRAQEGEKENG